VNLSCKVHRDGKIAQSESYGPLGSCSYFCPLGSCSGSYFGCGWLNSFSKFSQLLPQLISKTTSAKTNTTSHCLLLSTLQPHPISSYKPSQFKLPTSPSKYKNPKFQLHRTWNFNKNPSHSNYITEYWLYSAPISVTFFTIIMHFAKIIIFPTYDPL